MKNSYKDIKARFEALVDQYGPVALGIHLAGFALVFSGSAFAIQSGMQFESAAGLALFPAAYAVAKITSPFRIAATLVLTPPVAKLIGRGPKPPASQPDTDADTP